MGVQDVFRWHRFVLTAQKDDEAVPPGIATDRREWNVSRRKLLGSLLVKNDVPSTVSQKGACKTESRRLNNAGLSGKKFYLR